MSESDDAEATVGFILFLGIIITGISIGNIFGAAYGWLTIGLSLVGIVLFAYWVDAKKK